MRDIRAMICAILAATACGGALAQTANAKLDIRPQPLRLALKDLGEQTGLQIVFRVEDVAKESGTTPRISGEFSAADALNKMLSKSSQLKYRFVNPTTILISKTEISNSSAEPASQSEEPNRPLVLAQSRPREEQEVAPRQSALATDQQDTSQSTRTMEQVVVTGSHIRGEDAVFSVKVLDHSYIDSSGVATTASLIEKLPQNFALAGSSTLAIPGVTADGAQGSAINLRGIGEGTTLTLVNGRRLAPGFFASSADISALPLSAIERVEILTDGGSAIYGSDAIGGVVNFVLRKDFDGAETKVRGGGAEGGLHEYQASQVIGRSWGSGNALGSVEFYKRDLLPARARDFVPTDSLIGSLAPKDKNYSAMFSGQQTLVEGLTAFADALYTKRESFNEGGQSLYNISFDNSNPQLGATAGVKWSLGARWQLEASASNAFNRLNSTSHDDRFGTTSAISRFNIWSGEVKADGPLLRLPAGDIRAAVGTAYRSEGFTSRQADAATGTLFYRLEKDQIVRSAFAEFITPVFGDGYEAPAVRRLELKIAGRYDEYSTFGSSFDPQFGLMWEPTAGVRFRASHGTSFKAPNLPAYDTGTNFGTAMYGADSAAPGGLSYIFALTGADPSTYKAQRARTSSLGVEFRPDTLPGFQAGATYYRVVYRDRIATPTFDPSVVLARPNDYVGLLVRDPTAAQVKSAIDLANLGFGVAAYDADFNLLPDLDPATVQAFVDLRSRNLSILRTSGLDLSLQYAFLNPMGSWAFGLDGTRIFHRRDQVTPTSGPIDRVGSIYNPPSWRGRAMASWEGPRWSTSFFLNYTDSYVDDRLIVPVSVASYVTADLNLSYRIAQTTVAVSAQNVFNRDPPRIQAVSPGFDLGFDPTNASPWGRLVALELTYKW